MLGAGSATSGVDGHNSAMHFDKEARKLMDELHITAYDLMDALIFSSINFLFPI